MSKLPIVERLLAKKHIPASRPTIAELEELLAQPDPPAIQIQQDGSISTSGNDFVNPDGPQAATTITELVSALEEALEMKPGWIRKARTALSNTRGDTK